MTYVGTQRALAAYRAGQPVVVDQVLLRDGRAAVRVRLPGEVLPATGQKGVPAINTLAGARKMPAQQASRRREAGLWAAGSALALAVLGVVGWLVWLAVSALVALVSAHGWAIGTVVALLVLAAAGTGGCTVVVTVTHRR